MGAESGGDEGGLLNTEGLCCCMSTSTLSKETSEIKPYLDHHQITVLSLYPLFKKRFNDCNSGGNFSCRWLSHCRYTVSDMGCGKLKGIRRG